MQHATFSRRILAILIDCFFSLSISLILSHVSFYGAVRVWISLLIHLSYFVYPWMKYHKTFGMFVMGIEVTTIDSKPLGFKRSLVRFLGMLISLACFGLGLFWMFWDKQRQTWHDKFAGTAVIISDNTKITVQTPKLEIIPQNRRGKIQKIVGIIGLAITIIPLLIQVFAVTFLVIFFFNNFYFWAGLFNITVISLQFFFFLFLYLVGKDMENNSTGFESVN
jgi:uncharacterized RDD family membrane protein YckC